MKKIARTCSLLGMYTASISKAKMNMFEALKKSKATNLV